MNRKQWFFDWIWQYQGGAWVGFNPIGWEFEYDKIERSIAMKLVFMGIGFQIVWLVPWETEESRQAQEAISQSPFNIIFFEGDLAERDFRGDTDESVSHINDSK